MEKLEIQKSFLPDIIADFSKSLSEECKTAKNNLGDALCHSEYSLTDMGVRYIGNIEDMITKQAVYQENMLGVLNNLVSTDKTGIFYRSTQPETVVDGIIFRHKNSLYDDSDKLITNFIVDSVTVKRSGDGSAAYVFSILGENICYHEVEVKVENFRMGSWYCKYDGLVCRNPNLFRTYLESVCGTVKDVVIDMMDAPGWHKDEDGKYNFYTKYGNVLDRNRNVSFENIGADIFPVNIPETKVAQLFWQARNCTCNIVALLIMVFITLASNFTLFKEVGYPPKFVLFVLGERSSRKSSLVKMFAKLHDRKAGMTLRFTFMSTPASIDNALIEYKDCCLIVDDLCPSDDASIRRQFAAMLERVTRLFGDNIQRNKSVKGYKAVSTQGLAIITGEFVEGVSSSRSRQVIVEVDKGTVNNEILKFYQNNLDVIPGFLWNFLRHVAKNQDTILTYIKETVPQLRLQYQNYFEIARFAEYQSILEVGASLMLNYLGSVGAIDDQTQKYEWEKFSQEVLQLLITNEKMQETVDPLYQVRLAITIGFNEQKGAFGAVDAGEMYKNYYDEEFLYLDKCWLLAQVKSAIQALGKEAAIQDASYLDSVLKRSNVLHISKEFNGKKEIIRYTQRIPKEGGKIKEKIRFYKCRYQDVLLEEI